MKKKNKPSALTSAALVPAVVVHEAEIVASLPPAIDGEAYPQNAPAWDAPVFTNHLRTPKGAPIPGMVGVFTDDGHFLGSYAKETSLVQNRDVVSLFGEALDSLGMTYSRTVAALDGGRRMLASFDLDSVSFNGPDGYPIRARIDVRNSYDGTWKVSASLSLFRLICFNGMVGMRSVLNLAQKHSGKLDVSGMAAMLTPEVNRGMEELQAGLKSLSETTVDDATGRHILRNLARQGAMAFSPLTARRIETTCWDFPADDEKPTHNTLFGVLNAGTRYFRDRTREGKVDMGYKAGQYFNLAVLKAATEPAAFARLAAPVTWEDAYGVERN